MEKAAVNDQSTKTGAELLLEVAQRLFLTKGYANVSMQSIAEEAGMTKGAPYYHFASKEELFFQVSVRIFAEVQAAVSLALEAEGALEERLRGSIVLLVTSMSGDFSSWVNDIKRVLGPDMQQRLLESFGSGGDLSQLVLPSFRRAAERGEFTRATPEAAARVYIKLAMACIDETSYQRVAGEFNAEWLERTATEAAAVMVHGI
jgi:AcrR family transcriptional regulator